VEEVVPSSESGIGTGSGSSGFFLELEKSAY
jgi:hypothetical protein